MNQEPEFGWYGAGWASFKSDRISQGFMPPVTDKEAVKEWLEGFGAAHADCPDEEAIEGILQGDFSRGESFEDALLRIAPEMYVELVELPWLKTEMDINL
jgi:hypothetical protein